MNTDSLKVYQPRTEVMMDDDGIVIEQGDETGETVYITIDKMFLPIFIKWLETANGILLIARDKS